MVILREFTLKNRGKTLRLPSYFPVIFPVKNQYELEAKIRPFIFQVTKTILVSSYNLLKKSKLHENITIKRILENCFLFIDSGGFLLRNFHKKGKEAEIFFDDFNASYKDILRLQNEFANIGNNIDFLPIKGLNSLGSTAKLIEINSHFIELYGLIDKKFLFFPTVHAYNFEVLKALCAKLEKRSDYDGISVGGLVLLKNDWRKIIERLFYVKLIFNEVPIHAFGLGNPALLPILFSIGITSVDSSSYIKYALNLRYIHPISLKVLNITELNEELPCDCKICKSYSKSDLITMQNMGKAFIMVHNLHVYNKLTDDFRNKGDGILANLSKINPLVAKSVKIFKIVKEELSKFAKLT